MDIIVGITSVINIRKPSLVSNEERYKQTLEQIESVRKYIPTAVIILLECSKLEKQQEEKLRSVCDHVFLFDSVDSEKYCHTSSNKSLGELFLLTECAKIIENWNFRWFLKLNGRYKLNENFRLLNILRSTPVCTCIKGNGRLKILSQTVLYSVPKKFFRLYKEHMLCWLDEQTTEPAEHIFTMFLECVRKIGIVEKIGVSGIGATTGVMNDL